MKKNIRFKQIVRIAVVVIALTLSVIFFAACSSAPTAFELWQRQPGNENLSETDFINSLRGKSAFEYAQANGFEGTLQEWLASLGGGNFTPEELFAFYRTINPDANEQDFIDSFRPQQTSNDPIEEAIQLMLRSAVSIRATFSFNQGANRTGAGAGVILQIDRTTGITYIVTNYHVIYEFTANPQRSQQVRVAPIGREFFGGSGSIDLSIQATVIGGSAARDIAVLRTHPNSEFIRPFFREADIADSNEVTVGEIAIAVGNPEGVGISATRGIVNVDSEYIIMQQIDAADGRGTTMHRVMRVDAAINSGNSGGGIFNRHGQLIGVVNAKVVAESIDNIGYAIPVNVAMGVAHSVMRGQHHKYTMGVRTHITGSRAELIDGSVRLIEEVRVYSVESFVSNAQAPARGILETGDVLLWAELAQRPRLNLTREFMLSDELYWATAGDALVLGVRRNGVEITLPAIVMQSGSSRPL